MGTGKHCGRTIRSVETLLLLPQPRVDQPLDFFPMNRCFLRRIYADHDVAVFLDLDDCDSDTASDDDGLALLPCQN